MKQIPDHLCVNVDKLRNVAQGNQQDPSNVEFSAQVLAMFNSVNDVKRTVAVVEQMISRASLTATCCDDIDYVVIAKFMELASVFDEYVADPDWLETIRTLSEQMEQRIDEIPSNR